jgi:BASS family bile acid:Na+ symporter
MDAGCASSCTGWCISQNQYFQSLVKIAPPLLPPITARGTVAVLCGFAKAQSSSGILLSGRQVVVASSLLHASGFFFGYLLKSLVVPCAVSS